MGSTVASHVAKVRMDRQSIKQRESLRTQGNNHQSLGIPRIIWYFLGFVGYFLDFWSNIKVFGQNNMIFQLLQQK